MKIDKITINEFGALKDRTFSLKDGINVFEGINESGKSTVVSFIRFMLYGITKKSSSDDISDRERNLSWDGVTASGSMEFTISADRYRIERKYQLTSSVAKYAIDECKIIDLATGCEILKGEIPGKHFLNIASDVYDSTSCVRQLECTHIDGTSVRSSIENLLLSADEKIDTKKAQTKLDGFRKVLLHKNAKGGEIFKLKEEKANLEERLQRAKETAGVIITKENTVAKLNEYEAKHAKDERDTAHDIKIYDTCVVLKRFNELHAEEEKIIELQNSIENLKETQGFFGSLPDRDLLEKFEITERMLSQANDKLSVAEGEYSNAEASPCGDRKLAEIYERSEQNGGKQKIIDQVKSLLKKRKSQIVSSVIFYILGGILIFGGAFGLSAPLLNIDLSRFLSFIPSTTMTYSFIAASVIGGVLVVSGTIKSVSATKKLKKYTEIFAEYGINTKVAVPNELDAHITNCEENYKLCQNHDIAYDAARLKRDAAKAELETEKEKAISLLSSVAVDVPAEQSPHELSETLKRRHNELSEVCKIKENLEIELKIDQSTALSLKSSLEDYNESKLRAELPVNTDINGIVNDTDIAELKLKNEFAKGQYSSTMQKRIGLEKELIALNATSENPAKLAAKLDDVCNKLNTDRQNYDALIMAINAIDTASDNIRKNITPTLKQRAGELMGMLTAGKYSDLGLSANLEISAKIDGNTRSINALSGGTRDAAYISLRMALVELICGENPPPFIFDEGFSLLDDIRTKNILTMLFAYTRNGGQCLLFTCHKRETEILRIVGDFNHIIL